MDGKVKAKYTYCPYCNTKYKIPKIKKDEMYHFACQCGAETVVRFSVDINNKYLVWDISNCEYAEISDNEQEIDALMQKNKQKWDKKNDKAYVLSILQ